MGLKGVLVVYVGSCHEAALVRAGRAVQERERKPELDYVVVLSERKGSGI